jgi:hypothetical protein
VRFGQPQVPVQDSRQLIGHGENGGIGRQSKRQSSQRQTRLSPWSSRIAPTERLARWEGFVGAAVKLPPQSHDFSRLGPYRRRRQ